MRGYYPGEREYRERPKKRIRRPRLDQPLQLPRLKPPQRRRPPASPPPPTVGLPAPARERARPRERVSLNGPQIDWVVGIVLGIVLGLAVIIAFLAFSSEDTIDSPNVGGPPPVREAPPRAGG